MSFREDGAAALDWIASYLERVRDLPVLAQVAPGELRSRLPVSAPEHGQPFADVLRDVEEVLLPAITHWQSPRFLAYVATTGSEPAILGDLLASGLNNVGILWRASPALQELEEVATGWLAELLGLPPGRHGQLENTASLSTLVALAAARDARPGQRVVVCSEHAHMSVERAARLLGLETRKVPADAEFRLRPDRLDLAGACVAVATVGTTSCASVDPVPAIAEACASAGVWLHVDAAYAGAAMVCPEFRSAFDGVDRADSVVVNPHKWLFTTFGCSALWTTRPDDVRAAFSLVPEYLRTPDDVASHSEFGPELGRGFRALKLWTVLRCYGRDGLQERIREAARLAALFEDWVRAEPGWEICAPRLFSLVCFRQDVADEENEALLARVNASGEVFISHTKLDGRYVLRLAVGNARTTEDDVLRAWEVLRESAR